MQIIECNIDNVPLLAEMNSQLIQDEKAETDLSLPQLEERMSGFINSEYKAFLFNHEDKTVGYALCNMSKTPIYLRQFFICRDERRKGYGSQFFHALLGHLNIAIMDMDVFVWNKPAIAFYESIGFKTRYYGMQYKK
ncbi:MAG: GNAT family N-acetyltransferase [Chitinispirillales bacterium]|jgi:GNAT superfamily N-acetyltransferase|nr:GNAT family N-acetyltransferase [Chitinispirillales bacterium]